MMTFQGWVLIKSNQVCVCLVNLNNINLNQVELDWCIMQSGSNLIGLIGSLSESN